MDRITRLRQLDAEEATDSGYAPAPDCAPSLLAITTSVDAYPVTANDFYAMHPSEAEGDEAEGAAAGYVDDATFFYAFNVGTEVPPLGTRVIVHRAGGRWSFQYDG